MEAQSITNPAEYANHIAEACGVSCTHFSPDVWSRELPRFCVQVCPLNTKSCNCAYTHRYGCYEADRWGGRYVYYCPFGLIFIAANCRPTEPSGKSYLITGPILMGDPQDFEIDLTRFRLEIRPPVFTTSRVNHLAELITAVGRYLSDNQLAHHSDITANHLGNLLYDVSDEMRATGAMDNYPIVHEKELEGLIARADKEGAQELLNKLLGYIYFSSGTDFSIIKARAIELIVILSRASIEGGAEISKIFWLNSNYLSEVNRFTDIVQLSEWLTQVMHRFISYVFDFTEIKHVDVIFKALEYIKHNYNEKISLQSVAAHVNLSRSYLSKVFKDEMNCTFTHYVNQIRVEKSKTLLLNQELDIIEIALMVGFDDQSYFTKVFKKLAGVSPGKYRENRGMVPKSSD